MVIVHSYVNVYQRASDSTLGEMAKDVQCWIYCMYSVIQWGCT